LSSPGFDFVQHLYIFYSFLLLICCTTINVYHIGVYLAAIWHNKDNAFRWDMDILYLQIHNYLI